MLRAIPLEDGFNLGVAGELAAVSFTQSRLNVLYLPLLGLQVGTQASTVTKLLVRAVAFARLSNCW